MIELYLTSFGQFLVGTLPGAILVNVCVIVFGVFWYRRTVKLSESPFELYHNLEVLRGKYRLLTTVFGVLAILMILPPETTVWLVFNLALHYVLIELATLESEKVIDTIFEKFEKNGVVDGDEGGCGQGAKGGRT